VVRRLPEDFAAIVDVRGALGSGDARVEYVADLVFGLSFEPLRCLSPLLGDQFAMVQVDDAAESLGDDDGEMRLAVGSREEAAAVAAEIAAIIRDYDFTEIERAADLGALLESSTAIREPHFALMVPAILAAAGRFEEARAALDDVAVEPERTDLVDRMLATEHARTRYQLRRWIDSRGDESLLAIEAPPARVTSSVRETMSRSRALRDAVQAVRRASSTTMARAQNRMLLEDELERRGLDKEPLWIEVTLDKLHATPSDQLGSLRRLAGEGRRAATGIAKAIRDREIPDLSPPPWLDPPEPAYYKIPLDIPKRWVRVILDPDSGGWLEGVYEAITTALDSGTLDAWIDKDDASHVVVHLGSQRAGVVTYEHAERYTALLNAAAHRGELPIVAARLTRRADQPEEHLLELAVPPGSRSPA
jgi:hypothetical protein